MLKWKVLVGLVVSILVVGTAAQAQRTNTKNVVLTAADYIEIQQLYAFYDRGCDEGNGPMLGRAFAADATFTIDGPNGSNTRTGREDIVARAICYEPTAGPFSVRHLTTTIMIEPSPEGATGYAHLLLTTAAPAAVSAAAGQPAQIRTGIYQDVFVKGPEGWRIKKRHFTFGKQGPGPVDPPPNRPQRPAVQP